MDFKICPYCKISKKCKKKMKKLLLILLTILMLSACTSKVMKLNDGVTKETTVSYADLPAVEELVTYDEETTVSRELAGDKYIISAAKGEKIETLEFPVTFETVDIDGTLPVDLAKFYSNPEKLANLTYTFNEDETVMTITDNNGEEPHSFDVPVNVIYPTYSIAQDITIDTYVGYDINEFVTAEESVEVISELDEESSVLNITLSKNDWTVSEDVLVVLISSEPQYPISYKMLGITSPDGVYHPNGRQCWIRFDSDSSGEIGCILNDSSTKFVSNPETGILSFGVETVTKYWFEDEYFYFTKLNDSRYGTAKYILVE